MTFKEFSDWYSEKLYTDKLTPYAEVASAEIVDITKSKPFWLRNKVWKRNYEDYVMNNIVKSIENKMEAR